MFNNRNNFGDNPGMIPASGAPEPNYGMQWQGNNQMMMTSMMQPMMPGMMPGYSNYVQPPEHNYQPMIPPPMPPNLLGANPSETTPLDSVQPTNIARVNPAPSVNPPTPGPFIGPKIPTDEAHPAFNDPPEANRPAEGNVPASGESRKRSSNSPGRNNSSGRRSKLESHRSGEGSQGSQRDRSGGTGRRTDDRRRSRSRDRSRRGERRSKWDSEKESRGSRPAPGVMMMPNMPGQMFPPNMFPANIEMMGQAQLEMMKGQGAIMGNPGMNPGMNSGMNPMMGGMIMDPSMMGMPGQMYPQMFGQPGQVVLSAGMLEPPYPGAPQPARRERPVGCRTIFVGGLPDAVREETVKEIFERFGKISSMRLKKGFCHVRFAQSSSVEASFCLAGYRLLLKDHPEDSTVSSGLLIDYALNRDDQHEAERVRSVPREPTPPRVEHISAISAVADKIKTEDKFAEAVPTLIAWLEGGECSKKNANTFYSMIQATNNHTRRLMNDKMVFDEEFQEMKDKMKDRALKIITQLEQVVKVLNAANHKRVWDHFTKLQRKNVETWYKMSEGPTQHLRVTAAVRHLKPSDINC